ncbi:MAG TPA: M23 family metallopeptidase [Cyclobacteriaceae bacterium]|nr:M23 family metallopeptidase [Cyclobacteriaceae bacterium]
MPASRYYYNKETCKFEKAPFPFGGILFYVLALFSFSLLVAVAGLFILNKYYESPLEKELSKENADLHTYLTVLQKDLNQSETKIRNLKETDAELYQRMYEASPVSFFNEKQSDLKQREALILGDFSDFRKFYKTTIQKVNHRNKESQLRTFLLASNWLEDEKRFEVEFMPSIQPVENTELTKLVSGYGMRINPFHKGRYLHEGLDFTSTRGSEVKVTASGKVSVVKKSDLQAGFGNYIEVDHGNGYVTRYAHLEDILVKNNQKVLKGDVIATVGMSGGATAPHLHYEVIYRGENVNPIYYLVEGLDEREYEILKKLASRENQALD